MKDQITLVSRYLHMTPSMN